MMDLVRDVETVKGNSENPRETEGTSEQTPKSCATLFRLFVISPYLFSMKTFHPVLEDGVNLLVLVEKRLELFFSNYQSFKDVKLSDLLELMRSGVTKVKKFYAGDAAWQHLGKYVTHTHMHVLETLDRVASSLECVVPSEPDFEPFFDIETAGLSIRKKCFYILMNFFSRLVQKLCILIIKWGQEGEKWLADTKSKLAVRKLKEVDPGRVGESQSAAHEE